MVATTKRQKSKKAPRPSRDMAWGEVNAKKEKVYKLHAGQSKIFKSDARFTAAIAGTGGGKTVLGPLWTLRRIRMLISGGKTRGLTGMVIAPTYKVLSRATVPTLIETFRGTELEGRYLESKGHYVLPGGLGILYLLSADVPDSLEGGQLDIGAWLDEAGQMSYRSWLAVCRRTGVNQAPILITTTPYLKNWLKFEVLDRFVKGDPDYLVSVWASIMNPAYPKAEFERAKATLPKAMFDMMYRGLFTSLEGLVYPDFHLCITDESPQEGGRLVGGIDFGWTKPFCAVSGKLYVEDGKDILHIDRERYQAKCRLKVHSGLMPAGVRWFADPSEPEQIVDLKSFGHKVIGANNKVFAGIMAVNERILSARLRVSSGCINLITEAGAYQFPPEIEAGDDTENPIKGMDHAMDALRYLCLAVSRRLPTRAKPRRVYARKRKLGRAA